MSLGVMVPNKKGDSGLAKKTGRAMGRFELRYSSARWGKGLCQTINRGGNFFCSLCGEFKSKPLRRMKKLWLPILGSIQNGISEIISLC